MAKKVAFKVISIEGHTDVTLDAVAAVDEIRKLCKEGAKWLYVDGAHVANLGGLNAAMLENAEDITLTNQLAGGGPGDEDEEIYFPDDDDDFEEEEDEDEDEDEDEE